MKSSIGNLYCLIRNILNAVIRLFAGLLFLHFRFCNCFPTKCVGEAYKISDIRVLKSCQMTWSNIDEYFFDDCSISSTSRSKIVIHKYTFQGGNWWSRGFESVIYLILKNPPLKKFQKSIKIFILYHIAGILKF